MGARILVVDDSNTIRRVVCGILERHGFEPSPAADGQLAVEALTSAETPFDLVLLDFVMPKMNGFQFCRAIRARDEWKRLPVLLMSAKTDRIREQFVQQTGAIDAITKPFDAQALVAAVENALKRVAAGQVVVRAAARARRDRHPALDALARGARGERDPRARHGGLRRAARQRARARSSRSSRRAPSATKGASWRRSRRRSAPSDRAARALGALRRSHREERGRPQRATSARSPSAPSCSSSRWKRRRARSPIWNADERGDDPHARRPRRPRAVARRGRRVPPRALLPRRRARHRGSELDEHGAAPRSVAASSESSRSPSRSERAGVRSSSATCSSRPVT